MRRATTDCGSGSITARQGQRLIPSRILIGFVSGNFLDGPMTEARQNFRVSVTRAKVRTTVMTSRDGLCVLLPNS
jgi:hypothetical protein